MPSHRIIFGDSREVLPTIEPESVALTVTSPPYFVGREYEDYLETEGEYWGLMDDVFGKVGIATEPHGKVAINFADRYANSKIMGYPCEVLYSHKFDNIMSDHGFVLWTRIIWDKNRVYIDGARYLYHEQNMTGHTRVAPNWEYIFVWTKKSSKPKPVKQTGLIKEDKIAWTDGVWVIDSVQKNEVVEGFKLAKFPDEVPHRLIKMYTEPGDIVLDPFGGTCTVSRMAMLNNRSSICVEKNRVVEECIKKYLGFGQVDMFIEPQDITFEYHNG